MQQRHGSRVNSDTCLLKMKRAGLCSHLITHTHTHAHTYKVCRGSTMIGALNCSCFNFDINKFTYQLEQKCLTLNITNILSSHLRFLLCFFLLVQIYCHMSYTFRHSAQSKGLLHVISDHPSSTSFLQSAPLLLFEKYDKSTATLRPTLCCLSCILRETKLHQTDVSGQSFPFCTNRSSQYRSLVFCTALELFW